LDLESCQVSSYFPPTTHARVRQNGHMKTNNNAADVRREVGAGDAPWQYLLGEVAELAEAILSRDPSNIREEFSDVLFAAQQLISVKTGTNLPMVWCGHSLNKFRKRNERWKEFIEAHGGVFAISVLRNGSNFTKAGKVKKAFALAGVNLSEEEAEDISARMQGGE
jgi:hypothetical protein